MTISGLDGLAAALRQSTAAVEKAVERVIRKEGKQTADDAREFISGQISGLFLPHIAASITWEMVGQLAAEVGYDSGRSQGRMGRGVEFGSANHGPLPAVMPAADKAEDRLVVGVANAAVKATL